MPRHLSAAGNPAGDDLKLLKYCHVAVCFVTTLLAGAAAHKVLTWKREKVTQMAKWFASGVCLGTATIDLMNESDVTFHYLGQNSYPLVFLLWCTGYFVAMLADCLLVFEVNRVGRECFKKRDPKFIDKIMLSLISDLQPTKCCDSTLPAATSNSETIKECGGIGYLRYHILYRATVLGDNIVLMLTYGIFSMVGGDNMRSAKTKTMAWRAFLFATLYNITYAVSLVFTLLKPVQSITFIRCFLFVIFITAAPYYCSSSKNESMFGAINNVSDAWFAGIFTGLFSGVLVYISVHHLLANGFQLKMSISKYCFGKFAAMASGFGTIALLKFVAM